MPVAQLDRALACGAKGRTFESYRAYQIRNQSFTTREAFYKLSNRLTASKRPAALAFDDISTLTHPTEYREDSL